MSADNTIVILSDSEEEAEPPRVPMSRRPSITSDESSVFGENDADGESCDMEDMGPEENIDMSPREEEEQVSDQLNALRIEEVGVQGSIAGPTFWNLILDSLLHKMASMVA